MTTLTLAEKIYNTRIRVEGMPEYGQLSQEQKLDIENTLSYRLVAFGNLFKPVFVPILDKIQKWLTQ